MVDCNTTLQLLDLSHFRLDEVDESIKDHFENCEHCQRVSHNRLTFDRTLAIALVDVPIPMNLEDRLLAAVQFEQEQSAEKVSPLKTPKQSRSQLLIKVLAVLVPCLIIGAILLNSNFIGTAKLDYQAKLVESAIRVFAGDVTDQSASIFDESFTLDSIDSQLFRIRSSEIFGADLDTDGEQDIAGYRFSDRSVKGVLLVIPNHKLAETPIAQSPSSASSREYIWTNGKVTYFCYIETGSADALFDSLFSPV